MIAINARYVSDDMEVAASGKDESWKKGHGADHFEDEHGSHGDKGAVLCWNVDRKFLFLNFSSKVQSWKLKNWTRKLKIESSIKKF